MSPTLWACLQIGEINRVKETINAAKSFPLLSAYILAINNPIQQLSLLCKYMKLSFLYKVDIKPLQGINKSHHLPKVPQVGVKGSQ